MIRRIRPNWKLLSTSPQLFSKLELCDIGLDLEQMGTLRHSFQNLPIDPSSPSISPPTRFRRYAKGTIEIPFHLDYLDIHLDYSPVFVKEVDDLRSEPRVFQPLEERVKDDSLFQLITQLGALVWMYQMGVSIIHFDLHQVRLLAYPDIPADNAPEGIHQDGADWIVSALILNKNQVREGRSIIYNKNKEPIYETCLEEGEFIFQNDRDLWHDITPIQYVDGYLGYRDILGFDFKVE
jgi:hypothetical protein